MSEPKKEEDWVPANPTASPAHLPGTVRASSPPSNPYILALGWIGGLGLLVGVIVWGVGLGNAGSYDIGAYSFHSDSGVTESAIGGSLFGLGATCLLLLLCAQSVIWHLRTRSTPTP